LTASGLVVAVILMAIFTAINFLGVRKLATSPRPTASTQAG
jgi:hypothetical protein